MEHLQKEYVNIDWFIKILLGLVSFFLAVTFFTVQKTASDVSDLKAQIVVMQNNYNGLNERVNQIELNEGKK